MKPGDDIRSKHADEEQDGLRVCETCPDLAVVEVLVLDAHLVSGNPLDRDETLAVAEEVGVGRRVGQEKPDDQGPQTSHSSELYCVNVMEPDENGVLEEAYNVENQLPSLGFHGHRQLGDTHGDVGTNLNDEARLE